MLRDPDEPPRCIPVDRPMPPCERDEPIEERDWPIPKERVEPDERDEPMLPDDRPPENERGLMPDERPPGLDRLMEPGERPPLVMPPGRRNDERSPDSLLPRRTVELGA